MARPEEKKQGRRKSVLPGEGGEGEMQLAVSLKKVKLLMCTSLGLLCMMVLYVYVRRRWRELWL